MNDNFRRIGEYSSIHLHLCIQIIVFRPEIFDQSVVTPKFLENLGRRQSLKMLNFEVLPNQVLCRNF